MLLSTVYILKESDSDLLKIGMSSNFPQRLKTLLNSYTFDLENSLILVQEDCQKLESALHTLFKKYRIDHANRLDGYTEFFKQSCFNSLSNLIKENSTGLVIDGLPSFNDEHSFKEKMESTLEKIYLEMLSTARSLEKKGYLKLLSAMYESSYTLVFDMGDNLGFEFVNNKLESIHNDTQLLIDQINPLYSALAITISLNSYYDRERNTILMLKIQKNF